MSKTDNAANTKPDSAKFASGSQRVVIHPEGSRVSSGGSASVRSPASTTGSRSHSGSAGSSSWDEIGPPYEDDEIDPSDSASRARQPSLRIDTSGPRPEPRRRRSSRRSVEQEEVEEERPRRHHSSRKHHSSHPSRHRHGHSRRVPSDESSSTVASHDDYPYGHHGVPPNRGYPPQPGYRHGPPPGHGGYPPMSAAPGGFPDPYAAQALVHMPQQDPFGLGQGNPFSPISPQGNPFSPMGSTMSSNYFSGDPHAPMSHHPQRPAPAPRPQSFMAPPSHYGSEMMSPYGHPGMHPYYGMHPGMHPGYPAIPPWYQPPSNSSTPAPPAKEDAGKANEELITFFKKQEEARMAREEAALKRAEEAAAAAAARQARDEEEKKKQAEIAAAAKKAKEDAEKKALDAEKKMKEEHEKKLKAAEEARTELEKKQKASEEEVKKLQPAPDAGKDPIKFSDAVGRKFSFPFHLCKTWKGMEGLIKQAFLHVDVIGEHVHQGHYDLQGPDGEIILSQVWESMIQPGWEISMHMWPMPELDKKQPDPHGIVDPFAHLGLGDLGFVDPTKPKKKSTGTKKDKKKHDPNVINFDVLPGMGPLPPPPNFPPGMLPPDPFANYPPVLLPEEPKKPKRTNTTKSTKSSSSSSKGGFSSWFAGGSSNTRPAKKK